MPLDPLATTQAITDSYLSYLATVFRLKDENLQSKFEQALQVPDRFVKGPILEATPPFETGDCLAAMIERGILSPHFACLDSEKLPLTRPLYLHQQSAIERAVAADRNIVVATGTGSGKTESFLVPILDHLLRERSCGQLGPGVRALLLYPMNALTNDQVARLSGILASCREITFGRYTGETEEDRRRALDRYRKMYQREPAINELISREEMRKTPPHILLTNYAMLEYLLLRPGDSIFFDGPFAQQWRFLVVDEAHTYNGAKGIEMAMLLRRLKDRVVKSQPGRLRCIATSATLGRGAKDYPEVARFAEGLFGERFEWIQDDPARQDVVGAVRRPLQLLSETKWLPAPDVYSRWRNLINAKSDALVARVEFMAEGQRAGLPDAVLDSVSAVNATSYGPLLFEALKGDERVVRLRAMLAEGPSYLGELAHDVFGDGPSARAMLVDLVDLCARARQASEDAPLIPARYHLFARAVEGAYLALHPSRPLYLERQEQITIDGQPYIVCELATCRQCGATYLVGERVLRDDTLHLAQPGRRYFEDAHNLEYYLLLEEDTPRPPEDDDEIVSFGEDPVDIAGERYRMCVHCGALDKESLLAELCQCSDPSYVTLVSVPTQKGLVHACPACGVRSPTGMVWRFLTGNDATASVLATALYQQIPARDQRAAAVQVTASQDDVWSSTARPQPEARIPASSDSVGRQMLIFSDSRQDAAFFAPYLNRTYWQILRRRLILQALEENRASVVADQWRVQDLVNPLLSVSRRYGLLTGSSPQEQRREVWQWILYELLAIDRRNSLEGLGCLGFVLARPDQWQAPGPLRAWGLSEEEVWTLFQVLLHGFRAKGALLFPDLVSPEDDFFKPRNREYYFRQSGPNPRRHIFAWSPAKRAMNARLDYLLRVTERLNQLLSAEEAINVLDRLWTSSLKLQDSASCWYPYFSAVPLAGEGVVFRIKPDYWLLRAATVDDSVQWYYCDTCHSLTLNNLRGVCPTYRCPGTLRLCDPASVLRRNHYRRLYAELAPVSLLAAEHTAQLTSEAAAQLQSRFVRGDVNVLSCSTTFELGVDVGELESVFMRNVPPSAANYVQRAGRAGRRTESTAFALTFAQRRSHDLSHFTNPKDMVSGAIGAPHFEVANEKVVLRHVFATALAAFWQRYADTFGNVENFFFRSSVPGKVLLQEFLDTRPQDVYTALQRIVPASLRERLSIRDWGWIQRLLGENGVLSRAAELVNSDVVQLEEARQRLVAEHKPSDYILRFIRTIKETYLLTYLSRQNVIPKYGFPVDVVNLQILNHSDEARSLELDRDLRIALSEYAPGSQVVAAGKLWTSRYLRLVPARAWPKYTYAICDNCQCYQRILADTSDSLTQCRLCGQPLVGRNRGTFVVPEFGFMTSLESPSEPGDTRPARTHTTRTFYAGEARAGEQAELVLGPITLIAIPATDGQLAVINNAGGAGFRICHRCGFALSGYEETVASHPSPWRGNCSGSLARYHLGHEFKTDILQLRFTGHTDTRLGFWLSLLYALLEGASEALDIDRDDLDGCLYPYDGDPSKPGLILYDDVPGGAGHVRRIAEHSGTLKEMLRASLARLENCRCGGTDGASSCYGCLRNYRNQFCHEDLQRGHVMQFLRSLSLK